ncbi:F-actin-capping protein-like protein subunit alpha-2 [Myriangium duriaei CBS 260.36]|uniref:F-actin-capping protein subunit alpha n=1 Tax=Myriangium duriaei CBS 260.36 TaxID=1168546 RepID=A0A9P4IT63_9PEZI|nr:F-actin-capping protein-like protein subunit alpha-2 [Myriangium duriaei CBS 260.36]
MPSKEETIASFIQSAPPGQLQNVLDDIKSLTSSNPSLTQNLTSAFRQYNEAQLATTKLPSSNELVIISTHNALGNDRYSDPRSGKSFAYDHASHKASDTQSHTSDSAHGDLVSQLDKALSAHVREHYPGEAAGAVYPTSKGVVLLTVANKYSLNNFWSGRWRAEYVLDPSAGTVRGEIKVDVHYFEDGNVRLNTKKEVEVKAGTRAEEVIRAVAVAEKRYQEELNRGFAQLNEGVFKGLRRQLPVTRQRVEWDKVGAYRLGQDIGGGRSR